MKIVFLVSMVITTSFLLSGCKSEAEKKLEEFCSRDMSVKENVEGCHMALMTNCGGLIGVARVKDCAKHLDENIEACASIPSYCIANFKKAFEGVNKN